MDRQTTRGHGSDKSIVRPPIKPPTNMDLPSPGALLATSKCCISMTPGEELEDSCLCMHLMLYLIVFNCVNV